MREPGGRCQASTWVESPVPEHRSMAMTGREGQARWRLRGMVRQLAQRWRAFTPLNSPALIAL